MAPGVERDTRLFITPNSNQVLLHTYLTGAESIELKNMLLSSLKLGLTDLDTKKLDLGGISGDLLAQQERKTLSYLLVAVNGIRENAIETLLALPSSEYDAVSKEIDKIKNPTKPEN